MTHISSPKRDPAAALDRLKAEIADAAVAEGRDPASATLIAVSKNHGADAVRPCLEAGHREYGENRVQEAEGKWPALKDAFPNTVLHLIGPLQRNKVRRAVRLFDVLQTIDRLELARAVAAAMDTEDRRPSIMIQVNTGAEAQKHGVAPAAADSLIGACMEDLALPVTGLMCIPPADEDPASHFHLLVEIAERNGLAHRSMGMSGDYVTAVRCGATHVRIGTAIFGARPSITG
jgi:pyridoxal phosphate enzyme (YggS family)